MLCVLCRDKLYTAVFCLVNPVKMFVTWVYNLIHCILQRRFLDQYFKHTRREVYYFYGTRIGIYSLSDQNNI